MFYIYADGAALHYPLNDALRVLSPKLTLEIGKAGSLTFRLPPTNTLYGTLKKLKTIITVESDDVEIFRGRILSDERDFNNVKTVYCEGNLAYLVDSVQKGEAYTGTTHGLFTKILNAHNARVETSKRFVLGNVTVEDRAIIIAGTSDGIENAETVDFDYRQIAIDAITSEWKTTFDYMTSCLIDYCGGYLRARRVGDVTYLDYLAAYDTTATQDVEFGVNILDLTEEISAEQLFTVLIPLGDENLTIATVNNGSDELVDEDAVALYGRILRTHVFDSVTSPATLLENGQRYLASNVNIPVTVTTKAVDLHLINPDIDELYIGDVVHVKSTPHGVVDDLTLYKIEYDLENAANTQYTFGVPQQTLTERYKKDKTKTQDDANDGASHGGGSGGKAAGDKVDAELDRVYAEWIDWDPNDPDGHITIGASYKQFKDLVEVLKNEVGIELDAVTGNVNIKSLQTQTNENGQKLSSQAATIDLLQNGTEASIEMLVGRTDHLEDVETTHYASIILRANELKSEIELTADTITLLGNDIDGVQTTIASFSNQITTINSEITKVRNLVAEEINVLKANVDWLKGKSVTASWLYATAGVSAPSIYQGGELVATRDWVDAVLAARGFLTDNGVSWGNISDGFVWLNVDGTSRYMAMGNHKHSEYLTSLPSHRHSISLTTGKLCKLSNGATGWCVATGTYNTGYSS